MAAPIQRPPKTSGARTFVDERNNGYPLIEAAEVDAELDNLVTVLNTGALPVLPTIPDNTITAAMLVNGSVTTPKIADGAVTGPKIPADTITGAHIQAGTITDVDVSDVSWTKITGRPTSLPPSGAAGGDLTGSSYPAPIIAAGVVTRAKHAADCWLSPIPTGGDVGKFLTVGAGPALAWGTLPAQPIADGSVTTPKIVDGAVTDAKITSVAYAKVIGAPTELPPPNGSVTAAKMAPNSVGSSALQDSSIQLADIDQNSVPLPPKPNAGNMNQVLTVVDQGGTPQIAWTAMPPLPPDSVAPPAIETGAVTRIKLSPVDVLPGLPPIPGPTDANYILAVNPAGNGLIYVTTPPATLLPGQVSTQFIADAPNGVTDAKISSMSWSKLTGVPAGMPPSGAASNDLGGSYPGPTVVKASDSFSVTNKLTVFGTTNEDYMTFGSRTVKTHIFGSTGSDVLTIGLNLADPSLTQDDPAKPSWRFRIRASGGDDFGILRLPAGGAGGEVNVFNITNAGNAAVPAGTLTVNSPATSNAIVAGPTGALGKSRIIAPAVGTYGIWSVNASDGGTQDDNTKPAWRIRMDLGADQLTVQRAPAGGAHSVIATILNDGRVRASADPTTAFDLATKQYVDTKAGAYLPLAGGTLTGPLNATTGDAVVWGTSLVKARLSASLGNYFEIGANRTIGGVQDDNTKPSWWTRYRIDTDLWQVIRQAPAGGNVGLMTVNNDGRVTIAADPTGAFDVATKQYVDARALWSDTGTVLTPVTAARSVAVTGGQLTVSNSGSTVKGYVTQQATKALFISSNQNIAAATLDDITEPNWMVTFGTLAADTWRIRRCPPNSTTATDWFTLNAAGKIALPASGDATIVLGTAPGKGTIDSFQSIQIDVNHPWSPDTPASPSWAFKLDMASDQALIYRRAANAAAGTVTNPFRVQNDGKTYCTLADGSVTRLMTAAGTPCGNTAVLNVNAGFSTSTYNTWVDVVVLPAITVRANSAVMLFANHGLCYNALGNQQTRGSQRFLRNGVAVHTDLGWKFGAAGTFAIPNCAIYDNPGAAGTYTYSFQIYLEGTSSGSITNSGFNSRVCAQEVS